MYAEGVSSYVGGPPWPRSSVSTISNSKMMRMQRGSSEWSAMSSMLCQGRQAGSSQSSKVSGVRTGKYVLIFEIESLEVRNRDSPGDAYAPEFQKWLDRNAPTFDKVSSYLTTPLGRGLFTDYVTVGR